MQRLKRFAVLLSLALPMFAVASSIQACASSDDPDSNNQDVYGYGYNYGYGYGH